LCTGEHKSTSATAATGASYTTVSVTTTTTAANGEYFNSGWCGWWYG
jgi:hypothetical protein